MADPAERLLADTAAAWGLPLDPNQLRQFARYTDELLAWNAHTNLTAITDRRAIYVRHFLDSLALARFWGRHPQPSWISALAPAFPVCP